MFGMTGMSAMFKKNLPRTKKTPYDMVLKEKLDALLEKSSKFKESF
jgi:hypothetical protein